MTTATGDVSRNYAAQANANPWVDADFTNRNGMTAIIASNALKSNLNTNGHYSYTAALPDQNTWHTKGEKVFSSGTFDDHVGVGGITSAGNGYILFVNGNQWRIDKVTAFVHTTIGGGTNITHSAFEQRQLIALEFGIMMTVLGAIGLRLLLGMQSQVTAEALLQLG